MPVVNETARQPLSNAVNSMSTVGLSIPQYSAFNKLIDIIKAFFGNKNASLNLQTQGIYDTLRRGNITLNPGANAMADREGFYNYELNIDGHNNTIKLAIDKNNHIHLKHDEKTINLNTGQDVNTGDNIEIRHDLSPEFISRYFTMLLNNALSAACGVPLDHSLLPYADYVDIGDAGLMTSTMMSWPQDLSGNPTVIFDKDMSIVKGCGINQSTEKIKNECLHCHQYDNLNADLVRLQESTFITFNGKNIEVSSIRALIQSWQNSPENTLFKRAGPISITDIINAQDFFRYMGDGIKAQYGDDIFGGLTSEQGVYLLAMANSQGVTTQGHTIASNYLQEGHGFVSAIDTYGFNRVSLQLNGASKKYISVETKDNQASFKINLLETCRNENESCLQMDRDKGIKVKYQTAHGEVLYKAQAKTTWAVCDNISFGEPIVEQSTLREIIPGNLVYGCTVNLGLDPGNSNH